MITKSKFSELHDYQAEVCVSIYLPTHRTGRGEEDRIRLKNGLKEAAVQLQDRGFNKNEAREFLGRGYDLLEDSDFWLYLSDGVALFFAPDFFYQEVAPVDFHPFVYVSDEFYLRPLLPMLSDESRFFILALSQQSVRFFEGHRYSITPVIIDDLVPRDLEEALGKLLTEPQLQQHSGKVRPAETGDRGRAVFHGQGAGEENQKAELRKYLRRINDGLMEMLHDETPPLVIQAVDFLVPIYREVNTYPHLMDEHVSGNPDEDDPVLVHEKAWEVMGPHFEKRKEADKERFREQMGYDKASFSLHDIVPAAVAGKIDTLFVNRDNRIWGRLNREDMSVEVADEATEDNIGLLELAAVETYLHGGKVYHVDREELPQGTSDLNAIYRY